MSAIPAERISVHESAEVSVWCYPQHGIIHHRMHSLCYGDALRAALFAGLDALERHGAVAWLSDDRVNAALAPGDEEWATREWFPRTRAAGWRLWALVKPQSAIGALTMSRYVKIYGDLGVEARFFIDPDPAFEWLVERQTGSDAS